MKEYKKHRTYNEEQFIEAVLVSDSWAEVIRRLSLSVGAANYINLKRLAAHLELDCSHMTGRANRKFTHSKQRIDTKEYLVRNGRRIGSCKLKFRLFKEQILEAKCSNCNSKDWFGVINHLQLDHINGDKLDNRIENLRILCANCHSLTSTYCGNNIGRNGGTEDPPSSNLGDESRESSNLSFGTIFRKKDRNQKIKTKACSCGKQISNTAEHCKSCVPKKPKIVWPPKEELQRLVWEKPTSSIAKELGVSDKAVDKYCRKTGIQKPGRGFWMKEKFRSGSIYGDAGLL